ncbi:hypothetical protein [Nostoc sp. LEGE 12450]|uniref:hypothetical protein n=1 Tax=Nostoc sp. LEGE 12450 TaxID=1828643 RepID=UPI001880C5F5|nr:hypothetical protein [Nostoc sp. LEGE 12450]MBE8986550.1 hypothetical protein [Nostoc sp. LEGE 12450]
MRLAQFGHQDDDAKMQLAQDLVVVGVFRLVLTVCCGMQRYRAYQTKCDRSSLLT